MDELFSSLVEAIKSKFPDQFAAVRLPLKTATKEQLNSLRQKLPSVNDELCDFLKLSNDGTKKLPMFEFFGADEIAERKVTLDEFIQDYHDSYPDSPMNDSTNGYCKDEGPVVWIPFAMLGGGAELMVVDMSPGPKGTVGQVMIVFDDFHTSVQGTSIREWLIRMNEVADNATPDDEIDLFLDCISKTA